MTRQGFEKDASRKRPAKEGPTGEEFDLTKMSWGDHDILTATTHEYFNATSF